MNFERFFTSVSTFWEPCLHKSAFMKNVTPFPSLVSSLPAGVAVLPCRYEMQFDTAPMAQLFATRELHEAEEVVCRMLEDIALRLDLLQRGLAAHDFAPMQRPAKRIQVIADQLGLIEVSVAAAHVATCLAQSDGIALGDDGAA